MRKHSYTRAFRRLLRAASAAACLSAPTLAQDGPATGRVAYVEPAGALKVQQGKRVRFAEATVGMVVRRSYMLDLAPGAKAVVKCADGKPHQLQPGFRPCPCVTLAEGALFKIYDKPRTGGADTSAKSFPVIISPRRTWLLTTRPTIRWSPVVPRPGGAPVKYLVGVYTEKMKRVWEREVTFLTELAYPAQEPALTRGEVYLVLVKAERHSSDEERTAGRGFTVLTDEQAKAVNDAESGVRGLNLPAAETEFLVADLYAARGLSSEAIDKLTALKDDLKFPWVLLMLGDLYAAASLHREAITRYEGALALLHADNDLEARALSLTALGRSHLSLGEFREADPVFRAAQGAYGKMGVKKSMRQLKGGAME